jgi:ribosomal protein S18 acetylase RimI-like enzyme
MNQIKYANESDLVKIAKCHIAAFPSSLSSKMGYTFISNMMRWYLSAPNKFLFFIEDENTVIGYCGGHLQDGRDGFGAASGMTQFGFSSALKSLLKKPWLFFHPDLIARYKFIYINILRKLKLKNDKPLAEVNTNYSAQPLTAGLVVIGVRPTLQQKGLGTFLQQEFERKSIEMGAQQLQLSVRTDNARAIKSYQKNGYEITKEVQPSYIMIKKLN